jgi:hypothetical protein
MPFILLSGFLIMAAYPLTATPGVVWILSASQLVLLAGEVRKGQVTGAGAFIFMSFLFFGVRPVFLVLENDTFLFTNIYRIRVGAEEIGDSMWWASLALLFFAIGAYTVPHTRRAWLQARIRRNDRAAAVRPVVSGRVANGLSVLQMLTLIAMFGLAKFGRGLYAGPMGAYLYDLPVLMQAVHVFATVVMLERWMRLKSPGNTTMLAISCLMFLYFTWLMREVSIFRGFYVTGVMVLGIAVLMRLKGKVRYAWLIIPIIGLQPFFQYLGEDRYKKNSDLADTGLVDEVFGDQTLVEAYWNFYDSKGDMNIFDTFVAARMFEPRFYPYAWSWGYVPLHLIPRAVWKSKPKRGVTQDMRYTKGAPTSPGIAGFFLVDGGLVWMLLCMVVLGYLVSLLDWTILTMRSGYLQCCLIAIVTVNAMFLTRFFLWQYFYQVLYAALPCIALAWLLNPAARNRRRPLPATRGHLPAAWPPQTAG